MTTNLAANMPDTTTGWDPRVQHRLGIALLLPWLAACPKGDPRNASDAPVVSIAPRAGHPQPSTVSDAPVVSITPRAGVPLPSKDGALVEAGQAIASVMASSGALWPGWTPQAIIAYWPHEPYGAVLVTKREAPADFTRVANGGAVSTPHVYFRKGSLPGLIGNIALDHPVGELEATAVPLTWQTAGTVDVAFHEAFHRFQQEAFADALKGDPFVPDSAVANPEYLALRDVEVHLLRSALGAPPQGRKPLLHQYIAVRRHRMTLVAPIVEVAERHWERIEGSGSWVGFQAASLKSAPARGDIARRVRDELLRDLVPIHQGGLSERVVHMQSRGTGAALIALLDDMGIDPRPALERGHPVDEMLEQAIGAPPMPANALIDEAKRTAGYDALIATTRAWVDTLSSTTLKDDFLARAGFRVIIDTEGEPVGEGRIRFPTYNSTGFMRVVDRTTSIYERVEALSINEPGLLLTARKVPLMLDRRNAARFRFLLILSERPVVRTRTVNGIEHLDVTSSALDLQSNRATLLSATESVLHVLVSPPSPP